MSNYINQVSDSLKNHISELANNPCLFFETPMSISLENGKLISKLL